MVVTRGTSTATGNQRANTPTQASSTSSTTTSNSLFGTGAAGAGKDTPKDKKRKMTDPKLETIDIDKMHDLNLIVGAPGSSGGQKAFRINKGSFRSACDAWATMLNGKWSESNMPEIRFPDDSPFAFEIVLRVAHWQFNLLPAEMAQKELVELATLSDKYDLRRLFRAAFDQKQWLQPYKGDGTTWPADTNLQEFTFITQAVGFEADFKYLVSRLAAEVEIEKGSYFYKQGATTKVKIRADFPAGILARVDQVRNNILQQFLQACKHALLQTVVKKVGTTCHDKMCPVRQAGIMLKGLHAAGLYPLPDQAFAMYDSVQSYLTGLKSMGDEYVGSVPRACKTTNTAYVIPTGDMAYKYKCACFADYGIATRIKAIIKSHVHADIVKQWEKDNII